MTIERTANAIVALGSNLGDRRQLIDSAVTRIETEVGHCLARSELIETPAWIHPNDDADWYPPFLNGVAVFETTVEPLDVLRRLLAIETELGRHRGNGARPWQPRPIDLDLIAVDADVIQSPELTLPHPRMHQRPFVLGPLASVQPKWRHPTLGKTAAELLRHLGGRSR